MARVSPIIINEFKNRISFKFLEILLVIFLLFNILITVLNRIVDKKLKN